MFILEKIFHISNTALLRLEKFQNWKNSNAPALFILFYHSAIYLSILFPY
ncbi:hypothetical protein SCODD09_00923 [Streptococcus constellatus]|nr:hypothetical protein SCODD09_00923 [Streptococcus constellatus]